MKSIIPGNEKWRCFLCGAAGYSEEHHIFGGPYRKAAERYGLKVYLCARCHRDNKAGVHGQNREARLYLKQTGQKAFELSHGRKDFLSKFGKNYLAEDNEEQKQTGMEAFTWINDSDGSREIPE